METGATLWDESVVHEITVEFDEDDYERLIDVYASTGEKVWIKTTVTIDGTTYEHVGMRLKGNSSLAGLRSDGRGPGGTASADVPSELPWLIRLDEYVDGQDHEGVTELVVRSNTTETALNEALALDLLTEAGLASESAIATAFSVNGSESTLRLVVEHLDDTWMAEAFDASGALYKAESTGDYSYRGDDPGAYDEVFDQEAGGDNTDLGPLTEFLDFINNSDDSTLADDLPEMLDVEAFATYLAFEDIIDNFDDIDGPGNNSYLYYDVDAERFTVVAWDHNLAFGVSNGGGGLVGRPDAEQRFDDGVAAGASMPDNRPAPPDGASAPGGGGFGGPGGGSNVLVERFLAIDEFQALYDDAYAALQASLIDSGLVQDLLDSRVALLETQAGELVTSETVHTEAEAVIAALGSRER